MPEIRKKFKLEVVTACLGKFLGKSTSFEVSNLGLVPEFRVSEHLMKFRSRNFNKVSVSNSGDSRTWPLRGQGKSTFTLSNPT